VLTELLLGKNIFHSADRIADAPVNILAMPIPQFGELRRDIDARLEAIIQKALRRDRDKRYQTAYEMLTDLEL